MSPVAKKYLKTFLVAALLLPSLGFLVSRKNGGAAPREDKVKLVDSPFSQKKETVAEVNKKTVQAATPKKYSRDNGLGREHIGLVSFRIFEKSPELKDVMTLHNSLLRPSHVRVAAERHLQNIELIDKWVETLSRAPKLEGAEDLLRRAYIIDALQEAAAWKENPYRFEVRDRVISLLQAAPRASSSADELRALAVEKRELWRILKHFYSTTELQGFDKRAVEKNWTARINQIEGKTL